MQTLADSYVIFRNMKNYQRWFTAIAVIVLVAFVAIGGAYFYTGNKTLQEVPSEEKTIATSEDAEVYINIVNKSGIPFQPNEVWWYYPPDDNARTDDHPAKCTNEGCSRWAVSGAVGKELYVAAKHDRESTDPYCSYTAYDAKRVSLSSTSVPEVTLTLEEHLICE